jgi:hypothetical protein
MPRRPTGSQLSDQVTDLIKVLRTAQQVFPVYAEQARLELQELSGRLPTAERGADYSNDPPPHYNDPTGETVVSFRPARDGNCDPTQDLERIARWIADVQHLIGTTRRMLNNVPAVTLAVVDGRKPTDGRSAEEHAQRRFVRVLSGEPCTISQDHERTDRFGPGQLRRGLCNRHRMAFERWCTDQPVLPLERADRLARWQMATYGQIAKEQTTAGVEGPYKKGLKEVA